MTIGSLGSNHWVVPGTSSGKAALRLFCLPYAGGSAAIFRDWPARFSSDIDVLPLNLPGRGRRMREALLYDLNEIADQVVEAIAPLLEKPCVLFGHSMGACVAFEVARGLRASGLPEPACLIVSGHGAPHLPVRRSLLHRLPDEEFIDEVMRLNGTPPEILKHPEVVDLILPILRADFEAAESYSMTPQPPLTCRIVALGGDDDPGMDNNAVASWGIHTTSSFYYQMLPGDHFFLHGSAEQMFALINKELRSVLLQARSGQQCIAIEPPG
ncbi:alpha/beta fold hydrolase [Pseudomonas sp. Fl5BN2]|uniref:thioesterase II family protein n=1 Tax=Pseudomonas sp. Fl5BN2 TaxID=2697652 RepID=UPI001378E61B|nr:alpha/beta fold hydrolase [Pseudomonas sp. Fl5BN2]NBF05661.1 alpha/beta fold hydrolase [Pseudomonas sp. Fl5BN2]